MASKSPAELKSEGADLKAVLAKVKKKQHNCAMLLSKDGIVLEVHLKKSPEVLLKAAKKAGGMAKGAWGTITMDGQVIIIDPINEKIPGSLTKIAKKFFGERGLKNRLEIKEPEEGAEAPQEAASEEETAPARDEPPTPAEEETTPAAGGGEEETPAEDGATATEDEASAGGEEADPRAALEARLEAMQARIDELQADTENVMFSALQDMMGLFKRAVGDELFDRADDSLNKVETVLEDYDGLMAEKRPFLDRMTAMLRGVERVERGSNDEAATAIGRYRREFEYAVENSEWYSSGEKLDQMEALIGEQEDGGADEEEAETEASVEPTKESASPSAPESPDLESPASDSTGDARGDMLTAFKTLTPQIRVTLKSADKDTVKKVATLAKGFAQAIKGGDLAKCRKIMDMLKPMIAGYSEASTDQPEESGQSASSPEDEVKVQARGNRMNLMKKMRASLDVLFKKMK